MNVSQIRSICYKCGHRCLLLFPDSELFTDLCMEAGIPCGDILVCDEYARTPKKVRTHRYITYYDRDGVLQIRNQRWDRTQKIKRPDMIRGWSNGR
jgi:hypothetical protein